MCIVLSTMLEHATGVQIMHVQKRAMPMYIPYDVPYVVCIVTCRRRYSLPMYMS